MRLDKYLADMQIGTRSEVKKLIKNGRLSVNDEVITDAGYNVKQDDLVRLDGQLVEYADYEYYLLNKPAGVLCTLDAANNVVNLIASKRGDLFPVGRLDKETEGLILITNDGQLAHRLISPKADIEKTYYLETNLPLPLEAADILSKPIKFTDFTSKPAKYRQLSSNSALLTITEGKYHQVRRMIGYLGCKVTYLRREILAFLKLDDLKTGEYRKLTPKEIEELKKL